MTLAKYENTGRFILNQVKSRYPKWGFIITTMLVAGIWAGIVMIFIGIILVVFR